MTRTPIKVITVPMTMREVGRSPSKVTPAMTAVTNDPG